MRTSKALTMQAAKLTPNTVSQVAQYKGIRIGDPVTVAMDALYRYAARHLERFEAPLSEDYFLGPEWLRAITGVRALLNGVGDFDGGTLEGLFWDAMELAGFKEEDLL